MSAVVAVAAMNAASNRTNYSSRGSGSQDPPFPHAAECSPDSRPLPHYDQCLKVGTVYKLGVTGVWQARTLFLTKDGMPVQDDSCALSFSPSPLPSARCADDHRDTTVLGVAHRDTGFLINEIKVLDIVKVSDLRTKVEQGEADNDEHVLVQDEVDCCFNLYVQSSGGALLSRSTSPASPQSMPRSPEGASSFPPSDKHHVELQSFRAQSEEDREDWEEALERALKDAKDAELAARPPPSLQERIRLIYDGNISQATVMSLVSVTGVRLLKHANVNARESATSPVCQRRVITNCCRSWPTSSSRLARLNWCRNREVMWT